MSTSRLPRLNQGDLLDAMALIDLLKSGTIVKHENDHGDVRESYVENIVLSSEDVQVIKKRLSQILKQL